MNNTFRLLRASGTFQRQNVRIGLPDTPSPKLDIDFAPFADQKSNIPWTSVVIGRNGVGKSRLLAGIADIFDMLDRGRQQIRSNDGTSVSQVVYQYGDDLCEITSVDDRWQATKNGQKCDPGELPLPTRVIALTTTPFDKFRISRSLASMPGRDIPDRYERYSYLGLRDRTGRASPTAAIFRAIEGLFGASGTGEARRLRISRIFGFLGYKARIDVKYEISSLSFGKMQALANGNPYDAGRTSPTNYRRPLDMILERSPSALLEIGDAARAAFERAAGQRHFTLTADFQNGSEDDYLFRQIQILRKAELIRMRSAEITRTSDGAILDLKLASSGELGIVTGFLGLASVIEDGSLVFIDEPEISLHPEWQSSYINLLINTFENVSGCHFVLATHSPLILSDISTQNSTVTYLDSRRDVMIDASSFSGQSADHILATAFHVPGKNNLYVKQEIVRALRLAADGESDGDQFEAILSGLQLLVPNLEPESALASLIGQLASAKLEGAEHD